jgi:tetratricopeptide (TPR) repeat protein
VFFSFTFLMKKTSNKKRRATYVAQLYNLHLMPNELDVHQALLSPVDFLSVSTSSRSNTAMGASMLGLSARMDASLLRRAEERQSNTALLHEALEQVALRQYRKALGYLQEYLAQSRAEGNEADVGRAYRNIGAVYIHLKQPMKAIEFLTAGLQNAQQSGDSASAAKTLMHLGQAYALQGQLEVAMAYLREALRLAESAGAHKVAGAAMERIAEVCMRRGDYRMADQLLRASADCASAAGDSEGMALAEAHLNENRKLWSSFRRALRNTKQ